MNAPILVLAPVLLASCAVFPDDPTPQADLGVEVADKYVHRGMPQNRTGALQGHLDLTMPTRGGDTVSVGTFANMDLKDDVGRAWFPDGHAGRFTTIEYTGTYAHSFESFDLAAGVHNYNLPFGPTFPNGPRSSTSELFVHLATDLLGARPELQLRYDFDQADAFYWRFGVSEDFPLTDALEVVLSGHLGYSTSGQSDWNYGIRRSGWADLAGAVTVNYTYDANTVIGASVHGSTVLDDGITEWFDQIGIPETNYWASLFVTWSY